MRSLDVATSHYRASELIVASGLAPVATTVGRPRFPLAYDLAGHVRLLAPYGLLDVDDEDAFTAGYRRRLERFGADQIRGRLEAIAAAADAPGVVLLCFEQPGEFCHRRVFASWWEARTGQPVRELA